MRILAVTLVALAAGSASFADDKPGAWLEPGARVAGTLGLLYNVTGLDVYHERYHCLLTDYGLDPTVMIVVRGADQLENPSVVKLLQEIDTAVGKNTVKRLHAFVVVLDPSINDIVKDDAARYKLEKKLDAFAKDKLGKGTPMALCLCTEGQMDKFPLDKDVQVALVFYNNHRVALSKTFAKDQISDDEAMKTVKDGLGKILPAK